MILYFAGNVLSKGDQSMYDDGMRAKLDADRLERRLVWAARSD